MLLQVRTTCAFAILLFLSAAGCFCLWKRVLLCCSALACLVSFIWAQNNAEQAVQTRDGMHTRGRAGLTSTEFAFLWYRTMSAPVWSRIGSPKEKLPRVTPTKQRFKSSTWKPALFKKSILPTFMLSFLRWLKDKRAWTFLCAAFFFFTNKLGHRWRYKNASVSQ